jgi:hypothetical protein
VRETEWESWVAARREIRAIPGLSYDAAAILSDEHRGGIARYWRYRRRGLGPRAAYDGALAWARNANEQAARRCAHDTGAERQYQTW